MPTLYLHIGMPKTGTSAIQDFLARNREILKKSGYCFPETITFPDIGVYRNGHFLIREYYKDKRNGVEADNQLVRNQLENIVKLFEKYTNIILTDEVIWNNTDKVKNFWSYLFETLRHNNIQLKVIVFLRRQDLFIQSFWAQIVKQYYTVPFEKYIQIGKYKSFTLDYYSNLETISSFIGKENIKLKVYEKNISSVDEFCDALGLNVTNEFKFAQSPHNTSLSGLCLETKRILNSMPEYSEKNSFILPLLKKIQNEIGQEDKFADSLYFNYEEQIEFLKEFDEGNSMIAKEYLGRENGILFSEPITFPVENTKESYSPEDLLKICGKAMIMQQNQIESLKRNAVANKFSNNNIISGAMNYLRNRFPKTIC